MGDVKIHFRKSKDYRIIPVTGAWGGVNPQGEIVVDLFVEKTDIQAVTVHVEAGHPVMELTRDGNESVRELLVGVVMSPDVARSLGDWLIQKADEATVRPLTAGQEGQA